MYCDYSSLGQIPVDFGYLPLVRFQLELSLYVCLKLKRDIADFCSDVLNFDME